MYVCMSIIYSWFEEETFRNQGQNDSSLRNKLKLTSKGGFQKGICFSLCADPAGELEPPKCLMFVAAAKRYRFQSICRGDTTRGTLSLLEFLRLKWVFFVLNISFVKGGSEIV